MDDKEYAVAFEGPNGLDEIGVGRVKRDAEKWARDYERQGYKNITIKLYGDGDLQHQWDLVDGKFTQYE
jgi:hypothetical protein